MPKALVVLLDDDHVMRQTAGTILMEEFSEVEVQCIEDWHTVNQLISLNKGRQIVLICDVHMPGIDGCTFCGIVFKYYPEVRIIMMTGEDPVRVRKRLPSDRIPVVEKSSGPPSLLVAVRFALANV